MNCEQARNLFDAHLDGELSPAMETELGAHRLGCCDCRHELALMEVVGQVITVDELVEPGLDDAFTDRLLACLDRGQPLYGGLRIKGWKAVGSLLAAAAAIAITLTIWFSGPSPKVLGVKSVKPSEPAELDRATDSFVDHVQATWTQRADNAQNLLHFGEMTIMQILDRLGIDDTTDRTAPFKVMPDSFDELAPGESKPDDIEDL